jgi:catecholate siderophore receptor
MSAEKIPFSLRNPLRGGVSLNARAKSNTAVSMLTATCVATVAPVGIVVAQTPGQLPALNVEAPAEIKKKQPPRAAPTPQRASTARPAQPRAPATVADSGGTPTVPGNANPNADRAAPYKVDRSGNSKITQPLLDTARTITVIPKEVIEDKGATSFRDLIRTTPGVTLGSGEGGNAFGDRVFIRGFDARNDVYVDGVRDPGVAIRENFATEQVEIVKGPSATIAGRGSAGGAINVVTKKPAWVNFYNVETTLGTDMTRRVTADVNQVVSPEFAVRANGMWQNADVAGRDSVFDNRWGGLLAATWKPSDALKVTVDYYHLDLDQLPDWGVPFDARSRMPFTESGLRRENYYGLPNRDFQRNRQDIGTTTVEYKFSDAAVLTNKSRYGFSVLDYVAGAPGNPNLTNPNPALWTVPSNAKSRYQTNEVLANLTDLTIKFDTGPVKHTMVAGVELSRENILRDSYQALSTETFGATTISGVTLNLWSPNPGAIPFTGTILRANSPTEIQVDTKAYYVLDTLNFYERIFVTGGARIDDYDLKAQSFNPAGAVTSTLARHDRMFNWNAGITYKPVPIGSLYAAYATSSNPVGAELDGTAVDYGGITAASAILGPELNTSAELGTKWELIDRHLLVTAAVFQNTKDQAREQINANLVTASGAYEVRGLDIGFSGKLTPRLSVFGGVVLMESEVTKSTVAANIGQQLANIAHRSVNALVKYDLTERLSVGGQGTFKSEIWGGTFAANSNMLPASWRFDALAEYRFSKTLTAKAKVLNITNEVIYDAFYRSATPFVFLAPGRAAYLTLEAKL